MTALLLWPGEPLTFTLAALLARLGVFFKLLHALRLALGKVLRPSVFLLGEDCLPLAVACFDLGGNLPLALVLFLREALLFLLLPLRQGLRDIVFLRGPVVGNCKSRSPLFSRPGTSAMSALHLLKKRPLKLSSWQ